MLYSKLPPTGAPARTKSYFADVYGIEGHVYELLVTVTATNRGYATSVSLRRRIGFRTVALVTFNDSDLKQRAASAKISGSGQHGMFFRVNGVPLWARGANVRASLVPYANRTISLSRNSYYYGPNRWCQWSSLRAD